MDIFISKIDFTSPIPLNVQGTNPSWSPDGKMLVYENGGYIRKISSSGGTFTQITGPNCHNPCFQYKPH